MSTEGIWAMALVLFELAAAWKIINWIHSRVAKARLLALDQFHEKKRLMREEALVQMKELILEHEEAMDLLADRYGKPKGWRPANYKTPDDWIAEWERNVWEKFS